MSSVPGAPKRSTKFSRSSTKSSAAPRGASSPSVQATRFRLILTLLPHALPELTALFLPLAAWLVASRRGRFDELLAATAVTVAIAVPALAVAALIEVYRDRSGGSRCGEARRSGLRHDPRRYSAERAQGFLAVEQLDVLGLRIESRRTAQERCTKCGSRGGVQRVHAALLGQVIALPRVAAAAGGHHVGPVVVAAARERNQVIPREALAVPQLDLAPVAVLAPVPVTSEEECVGDLPTEAAGDVHEFDQPDDRWFG